MASLINYSLARNCLLLRERMPLLRIGCRLASSSPSSKTTVFIHDIGMKATSESFQKSLGEIDFRKAEVQPGCSLHVLSEMEAVVVAENLSRDFKVEVRLDEI